MNREGPWVLRRRSQAALGLVVEDLLWAAAANPALVDAIDLREELLRVGMPTVMEEVGRAGRALPHLADEHVGEPRPPT